MATFSTARDDALGDLDLVALLATLQRGEVSAAEVRAAALTRAHDADRALNAVVSWVAEARPIPDATSARLHSAADHSRRPGPFAGIPTFAKDNEQLAGLPTRAGSRAVPPTPAPRDSDFVAHLTGLGFDILGSTTMPEFGLTATTESLLSGPTRNPWHLGHSVGGSSGGAGALVAAGAVPLAHANDGGGSIRIPAACCGLVGLKPSRGRLPVPEDSRTLPVQIVSEGVLTRTVRDTAAFYAAAGQEDPALPPIGDVRGPGRTRLRIAFYTEGITGAVDPDVAAATRDAAGTLAAMGHSVEHIDFPFDPTFGRDFLRYWAALAFTLRVAGKRLYGRGFDPEQLEPFSLGLAEFFRGIAPRMPATIRRLRRFAQDYDEGFRTYDVLLSPTTGTPAPPLGYLSPALDFRTHIIRLFHFAGFTTMHNVAGAPAISLPWGQTSDGIPLAVQLASRRGHERRLLELAYEAEATHPWPLRPTAGAIADVNGDFSDNF